MKAKAKDTATQALLSEKTVGKMWRAYNNFPSAPPMSKAGIKDMFDDFSPFFFEVAQAQAEISFKAGKKEAYRLMAEPTESHGRAMFKAGLMEVVEWITRDCLHYTEHPDDIGDMLITIRELDLQAKLKEWGIK